MTSGALGLRIVTQAAMLTLAANFLGPAGYGTMTAATSIATILSIIPNLGAGLTVIAQSQRDPNRVAYAWRFIWPQHLLLGPLVASFYAIGLLQYWSHEMPAIAVVFIALSEIVVMPLTLQLGSMLQALDRVPLSQFLQWIVLLLRVSAIGACVLYFGAGSPLIAYAESQLLATIIGLAITATVAARYIVLTGSPRLSTRTELVSGIAYCATSGVGAASMEIDKVAALHATTAWDAGIYATMSRVVSAGTTPIVGLLMTAQPRLFAHGASNPPAMRSLVKKIAALSLAVGVLGCVGLNLCEPLLQTLFGPRFSATSQILPIMSLAVPAMSLRLAGTNILLTLGKPFRRVIVDVSGIIFLTISMLILGNHFGLKGLGIALVTSEFCLATCAWAVVLHELSRALKFPQLAD